MICKQTLVRNIMAASLKFIEIENFKSYKRKTTLGPIQKFTAIIGSNGSGKSNIMDAVRFALGEKASNLRVNCLSDLVYGTSFGKPATDGTGVTLIFSLRDNVEISFKRIIQSKGSQYRINNEIVNDEVYKTELRRLNLDIQLGHFFIPQEHAESMALHVSKERTVLFERLSGSIVFKAEYERLKSELLNVMDEIQTIREKKRQLLKEIKYTKEEKEEAEEYLHLQEKYIKEKSKFQTIRLFLIKKVEETSQNEEKEIKSQIERYLCDKENVMCLSQEKKSQLKLLLSSLESVEQDILELENVLQEKKVECKDFKEAILYWQKKRDCAYKSMNSARKVHNAHEKILQELKEELQVINSKLVELEETPQESSVSLSNSEVNRYMDLKNKANIRAKEFVEPINNLKRDQQTYQDKLDNNIRHKQEVEDKLKRTMLKKEDLEIRFQKLHCLNEEYALKLIEKTEKEQKLSDEITEGRNRISIVETECTKLKKDISEKKVDKHIHLQQNKNAKILNMLKEHCSGVYGRLYQLCKPIHERYNIAVTKVFGQYMDAIVVDTKSTAQECIEFLRLKKLGIEIFLPLDDSLKIQPLKKTLRAIREPFNVKLLYDVLNISSPNVSRAVLFVTRNTLVCETADDARKVAYESHKQTFDCVSLDGCYFRKSGIFSGGQVGLLAKAKQWTNENITELQERKEKLMSEYRELSKLPLKICERDEIAEQIKGLTFKKNYTEIELKDTENNLFATHKELSALHEELSLLNETKLEIERSIQEIDKQIGKLQNRVHRIETEVFADFCRDIDISDIGYYEKNNLRYYKELNITQIELKKQKDCIENQLCFESERDTRSKVLRWKRAAEQTETELNELQVKENIAKINIKEMKANLLQLKENCTAVQKNINDVENELAQCKLQIDNIKKLELAVQKKHIDVQKQRYQRKTECNCIFTECKIEDITIPMLSDMSPESFSTSLSVNWDVLMQIDFSQFPEEMLSRSEQDLRDIVDTLNQKLTETQKQLGTIENPNLKAHDKMDSLRQKMKELTTELLRTRKTYVKINSDFEVAKKKRFEQFSTCLEKVCEEIDSIYKNLVSDPSAQVFILPENPEEPYLGGITYSYKVSSKHFQPLQSLSGGEKVLATLALLFAFQRYKPTPFFFIDESDASLDEANTKKFVSFIQSQENVTQFIVITLKRQLFTSLDSLIGVTAGHNETEPESKVFAILLKHKK